MVSGNALSYLMLAIWPLVAWSLWLRLDAARALIWTVLGGYLLLPPLVAFNLPLVPDLNKVSIPNLAALACVLFLLRDKLSFLPDSWLGRGLIGLFILSPFATVLTNPDPLRFQVAEIQGMRLYDSVAYVANQAIILLPFFLARRYLASAEALRAMLVALVLAGVAYSVPMLIEMRLSPQMNVWVYGFFQHDFFQTIRFGGYRPVVFLQHGLWVAFFALMCAVAAAVLFRHAPAEQRPKWLVVWGYLTVMLILCKSAGPVIYAIGLLPMVLVAPRRLQVLLGGLLALVVITYPALRGLHVVPLDQIVEAARGISTERADSLAFRVMNEELLLEKAEERPWFGWGGYGRGLIHDPVSGRIITIADGAWIILLGMFGWMGYVAEFGLTALPLLLLSHEALRRRAVPFSPYAAAVVLLLAANMVDMLPNATHIPFTWLMAGALTGHAEALARARRARQKAVPDAAAHPRRTVI